MDHVYSAVQSNDIVDIVYRLLHNDAIRVLNKEYKSRVFTSKWVQYIVVDYISISSGAWWRRAFNYRALQENQYGAIAKHFPIKRYICLIINLNPSTSITI